MIISRVQHICITSSCIEMYRVYIYLYNTDNNLSIFVYTSVAEQFPTQTWAIATQ